MSQSADTVAAWPWQGWPGNWVSILAMYNAERSRGIMHTPEWQERMATYQEAFDSIHVPRRIEGEAAP